MDTTRLLLRSIYTTYKCRANHKRKYIYTHNQRIQITKRNTKKNICDTRWKGTSAFQCGWISKSESSFVSTLCTSMMSYFRIIYPPSRSPVPVFSSLKLTFESWEWLLKSFSNFCIICSSLHQRSAQRKTFSHISFVFIFLLSLCFIALLRPQLPCLIFFLCINASQLSMLRLHHDPQQDD